MPLADKKALKLEKDRLKEELKVKEKEKKENGEVFTPLSLVNEMLDKLDEAYIKEHGKAYLQNQVSSG